MPPNKENELITQLAKLNETLERANSYKISFFRGLLIGLGSALGATFVAVIIISILIEIISSAGNLPVLHGLINNLNLNQAAIPQN